MCEIERDNVLRDIVWVRTFWWTHKMEYVAMELDIDGDEQRIMYISHEEMGACIYRY